MRAHVAGWILQTSTHVHQFMSNSSYSCCAGGRVLQLPDSALTTHHLLLLFEQCVSVSQLQQAWTAYLVGCDPKLALLRVWTLLQHIVDESKELLHHCILPHVIIARLDLQPTPQHACWYTLTGHIKWSSIMLEAGMLLTMRHTSCINAS